MPARRRSIRRCRNSITAFRNLAFMRSHALGLEMTSARKNDGHSPAACATSPHRPQPMQLSITVATGSLRSGSGFGCNRKRWAAGEPNAGVVAGAGVGVHAKPLAHHALVLRRCACFTSGFSAALLVQSAFALRHNHLRALFLSWSALLSRCRAWPPRRRCA